MNIVDLETRRDWPLIVSAVPCEECNAQIGDACVNIGDPRHPMLQSGAPRIDWHAKRKYAAATEWYALQKQNEAKLAAPTAADLDQVAAEEIARTETESIAEPPVKKKKKK